MQKERPQSRDLPDTKKLYEIYNKSSKYKHRVNTRPLEKSLTQYCLKTNCIERRVILNLFDARSSVYKQ